MRTCGRGHEWNQDLNRQCPVCQKAYRKKRYAEFREHDYKKSREWVEKNQEKVKQNASDYAKKRPGHCCYRTMINRCYSPKNDHYHCYGGRGITVCERWLGKNGYANFIEDMGERPSPKHTIERLNVNGNYEPNNCTWATRKAQGRNRRYHNKATIEGDTKCLAEWAEDVGVTRTTFLFRTQKTKSADNLLQPNQQPEQKGKRAAKAAETNDWIQEGIISREWKQGQNKGAPAINGIGATGFAEQYGLSLNSIGHFGVANFAAASEEERLAFVARCKRRAKGGGKATNL